LLFDAVPVEVLVHCGFNGAVFDSAHLDDVLRCVDEVSKSGGDCTTDAGVDTSTLSFGRGGGGDDDDDNNCTTDDNNRVGLG
jgi:hypothetical protein